MGISQLRLRKGNSRSVLLCQTQTEVPTATALADFREDRVLAFNEMGIHLVLVHRSAAIHAVLEDAFAVQPYLISVVRAETDLSISFLCNINDCVPVAKTL